MDESSCQISAIVLTLANSYGSHSAVFLRILWMFFMFLSNTVCLKKYWLIRLIAECHYVNLLIFLAIIEPLFAYVIYNTHLLKNVHNTDCEFIAKNVFSFNFTFCSIHFYYVLNILTTLYLIGSWNATRTYPVQCWHDMKVSLFVRSENYTQVCDHDFYRAGKVS